MSFESTDLLSRQDDIIGIHDFTQFWSPVAVADMDNHLKKVCMCPRVLQIYGSISVVPCSANCYQVHQVHYANI